MTADKVLEVVGMIEEYLLVAEKVVPLVAQTGKKIKPLLESLTDTTVDLTIRAVMRYEKAGMTREEAILLSLSTKIAIKEATKNMKKS